MLGLLGDAGNIGSSNWKLLVMEQELVTRKIGSVTSGRADPNESSMHSSDWEE